MCIFLSFTCVIFALNSFWLCCVFIHATLCPSYRLYSVLLYNLCWKAFSEEKKKWIKLGQKWLCNAILHVDMQMVRKKTLIFDCERFKMGEKKNKMLLNLYTSLLDFFGVLMKFDRKLSRQGEIQLADSQHSDGHFPVCQRSSVWNHFNTSSLHTVDWQTFTDCGTSVQQGICWLTQISVWIFMWCIYTDRYKLNMTAMETKNITFQSHTCSQRVFYSADQI